MMMTKTEVAEFLRVSTKTVERGVKAGIFPEPIYLGPRSPRWDQDAIMAIYASKQAADQNSDASLSR